jgi:hypothetical protein
MMTVPFVEQKIKVVEFSNLEIGSDANVQMRP